MIFAQGRTGSTLLTSSLDSHPQIRCADEVLRRPRLFPVRFIENRARGADSPCFGFHVKCYQLTRHQRVRDLGAFLRLIDRRGWQIIYLWREDPVRQVISGMFARSAGHYHYRNDETGGRPDTIDISPARLISKIEKRLALVDLEHEALHGIDYYELRYERDLLDPDKRTAALNDVQDFIGVPRHELRSELEKSVHRPLAALISNYDEVARALAETPFAQYWPANAA